MYDGVLLPHAYVMILWVYARLNASYPSDMNLIRAELEYAELVMSITAQKQPTVRSCAPPRWSVGNIDYFARHRSLFPGLRTLYCQGWRGCDQIPLDKLCRLWALAWILEQRKCSSMRECSVIVLIKLQAARVQLAMKRKNAHR